MRWISWIAILGAAVMWLGAWWLFQIDSGLDGGRLRAMPFFVGGWVCLVTGLRRR